MNIEYLEPGFNNLCTIVFPSPTAYHKITVFLSRLTRKKNSYPKYIIFIYITHFLSIFSLIRSKERVVVQTFGMKVRILACLIQTELPNRIMIWYTEVIIRCVPKLSKDASNAGLLLEEMMWYWSKLLAVMKEPTKMVKP